MRGQQLVAGARGGAAWWAGPSARGRPPSAPLSDCVDHARPAASIWPAVRPQRSLAAAAFVVEAKQNSLKRQRTAETVRGLAPCAMRVPAGRCSGRERRRRPPAARRRSATVRLRRLAHSLRSAPAHAGPDVQQGPQERGCHPHEEGQQLAGAGGHTGARPLVQRALGCIQWHAARSGLAGRGCGDATCPTRRRRPRWLLPQLTDCPLPPPPCAARRCCRCWRASSLLPPRPSPTWPPCRS